MSQKETSLTFAGEMTKRIYEWVELVLGVDVRSLALFRILLGGVIVYDLGIRFSSLNAHYTDNGILTRAVLREISENPLIISVNMLGGSEIWQALIFVSAACFAVLVILGYRTRLSTILCAILILSIHVRNPFLNNLGDWFLLNLLFWSTMLPLGATFSLDANIRGKSEFVNPTCLSVASMGMTFQVLALYFFSVYYKISPVWHAEGSAVYYALSLDRLVTSAGEWVLTSLPEWLSLLTNGTLFLEKWGPLLLFVPFFTIPLRIGVVFCFTLFHVGLMLTLELGIFPWICIAAWMLFLPGKVWDFFLSESVSPEDKVGKVVKGHGDLKINWLETLIAIFLLLVMISSNLLHSGKMSEAYYERGYKYVEPLVNSFNLRQRWNMFSPHPSKQDGWFLVVGVKDNGTLVNLTDGGSRIDWRRPRDISRTYINQRWRKNFEWVMMRWDPHARLVSVYMKDAWNASREREEQVNQVLIYFMTEYTQDSYNSTPVERKLLYGE